MKKEFPIINLMLILITIGMVCFFVTHNFFEKKSLDSEFVLKHIKDIEENALTLLEKEGNYTYEELALDVYLEETFDIKCESYNITTDKVISASNCDFNNLIYCYNDGNVSTCNIELAKKEKVEENKENNVSEVKEETKEVKETKKETEVKKENEVVMPKETFIEQPKSEPVPIPANVDPKAFVANLNVLEAKMPYNDTINIEIPDKYNTGVRSGITLESYKYGTTKLGGIKYILDTRGTVPTILLRAADLEAMSGDYVIENVDFRGYAIRLYTTTVKNNIRIKFKNCIFDSLKTAPNLDDHIKLELDYCTLVHFDGSNVTLNHCRVGGGSSDGINPFKNVYVKNSYIADISGYTQGGESHYDGMQIYGSNSDLSFFCHDVHFYNTRFEMPFLIKVKNGKPSSSYVNAPIMVQLEFNNASNISFEKVYVNGGGYSIYSHAVNGTSMTKVSYKDVYIGYGRLYGMFYPMQQSDIVNSTFNNVGKYDKLYVSSVWKDSKGVHVITTNDTLVERKMRCVTNVGNYDFTIPAHPRLTKAVATNYTFESLPYDLNEVIPNKNVTTLRCYDITGSEELTSLNLIKQKNL